MAIAESTEEVISKLKDLKEKVFIQDITESDINQTISYENQLSSKLEECASTESFYSLPFEAVLSIVSQTDFSKIQQPHKVLYEIIDKSIQIFNDNSILLLQNIHIPSESIPIDECFQLIGLFSNSQILTHITKYYEILKKKIGQYEENIKKQESYIKILEANAQKSQKKLKPDFIRNIRWNEK